MLLLTCLTSLAPRSATQVRYVFDCFLHPAELIAHNPSLKNCKKVPLMRLVCVTLQDIVLNKRVINYPLAIELLEEVPNLCPHIQFDFQFGSLLVDMKSQVCV